MKKVGGAKLKPARPGGVEAHAKITSNRNSNNGNVGSNQVTSLEGGSRSAESAFPTRGQLDVSTAQNMGLSAWGTGGGRPLLRPPNVGNVALSGTGFVSLPASVSLSLDHSSNQPTPPYDW